MVVGGVCRPYSRQEFDLWAVGVEEGGCWQWEYYLFLQGLVIQQDAKGGIIKQFTYMVLYFPI